MKSIFIYLFTILVLVNCSFSQSTKIHPYLQAVMNESAENEMIPAYILFNDHLNLSDFDDISYDTPKKERRNIVISRLKKFANDYQRDVRQYLGFELNERRIKFFEILWINNTIQLEGKQQVIKRLATDFDRIQMICYDQTVPEELLIDNKQARPPFSNAVPLENRSFVPPQAGLTLINAIECWVLGNTGQGVLIANVDNGFEWRHQDVVHQIWQNLGEDINGNGKTIIIDSSLSSTYDPDDLNGIDDDNNGKVDDLIGWDFTEGNYNITVASHGTSTLGIVVGDGTMGTQTGVAPDARCMVLRNGDTESNQWAAFQYAVEMGAEVITSSLSWKWYFIPKPDYSAMRLATDMSLAAGVIHTNSTSNRGNLDTVPNNISTAGNCPPPWLHPDQTLIGNLSGVIGVGNVEVSTDLIVESSPWGPSYWGNWHMWGEYTHPIDSNHRDYPYSRTPPVEPDSMGLLKPDVTAPGDGTTSITTTGGYGIFSGTSGATPHVGGTIALMLSINPELLPADIDKILELTSIEKGDPGKDYRYGSGRIDAYAATTSPKFTLEGIEGGSNMLINNKLTPNDNSLELAGFKISTNVNPQVGSLKYVKFGMITGADSSHISRFNLHWDVNTNGIIDCGDVHLKSLPFTDEYLEFDTLKFKFLDTERTIILSAKTTDLASGQTINFEIIDTSFVSAYYFTNPFSINFPLGTDVGVNNSSIQVLDYSLSQNYPNPFNPLTIISYSIGKKDLITIKLYDVLGREIATLVNNIRNAGNYKVEFDTRDYPGISSGIYYYKMTSGEFTDIKKMILLK